MIQETLILPDSPRRFGHILLPDIRRNVIPKGRIGTYILLNKGTPIYGGRSDHCLLSRLLKHEHICEATHVVWEPCKSRRQAFAIESAWYHHPFYDNSLINQIHPARPNGYQGTCPFCVEKDKEALAFALSFPKPKQVFADQNGGKC